jgi:hypothetical protein
MRREPELPFPAPTGGLASSEESEKASKQMWAKVMNKLNGFEGDLNKATAYVNNLIAESANRISKFERSFQPLANTIEWASLLTNFDVLVEFWILPAAK